MCIPDVDVLADYPIDYKFPAFGKNKKGESRSLSTVKSRFYDIVGQQEMQRKIETRYLVNIEFGHQTF